MAANPQTPEAFGAEMAREDMARSDAQDLLEAAFTWAEADRGLNAYDAQRRAMVVA